MITIGIAAYKEPNVSVAVNAVLSQKIKEPFELIVACPDDETAAIVKKLMKKNPKIKLIKEEKREGQPAAYNKILKVAKGNVIMLTDADAILEKDAVQKLVNAFDDPKVGAVGGQPKPMNKRDNRFGFWAHYLFAMGHKVRSEQSERNEFYYISGPILAIRRGVVDEMPKNAMATDAVLGLIIKNKGWKVVYVPDAIVYQKAPENLKDYFAQKRRTMAGFYQMKRWFKIRPVRTFTSEAVGGFFEGIKFARSPIELMWFLELCFYRVLAWVLAYYDLQIKKKSIEEIWTPIESTK